MAKSTSKSSSERDSDGEAGAERKIVRLTRRVGSHLVGETMLAEQAEQLGLPPDQYEEVSG